MNKICCLNPDCDNPSVLNTEKFCVNCGTSLTILRNRYRPVQRLGDGGFGKTYLAEDIDKLNELCVIKQLAPQVQNSFALKKATELFEEEAKRLKDLAHSQIPKLQAYFDEDNRLYLIQDFIDGENLLTELTKQGNFTEQKIRALLLDLLPVLQIVHDQNIIHRDIKPENIMRRRRDGKLFLIDFGASKEVQGTVKPGTKIGTYGYAAIEQMQNRTVYPASDLFSIGATCFHLLTTMNPGDLWTTQGYSWTNNWRIHLSQSVTVELAEILDKLLQLEYQNRYQSAEEVITALKISPTSIVSQNTSSQNTSSQNTVSQNTVSQNTVSQNTNSQPTVSQNTNSQPTVSQNTNSPNTVSQNTNSQPTVSQNTGYPTTYQPTNSQNTTVTPKTYQPINSSRRIFIKYASLSAAGLIIAGILHNLFKSKDNIPTPINITATNNLKTFTFETVKTNSKGIIINKSNESVNYFVEDLGKDIKLEMVEIPGGSFDMGSPTNEKEVTTFETPQHQVTVPRFFMARYQLTQAQYSAIMGSNPSNFPGDNRPVENVSWDDAMAFCEKLNEKTGKKYRLPSEAEWEYACRAGTITPFYFGETITTDLVNYNGNYPYGAAPKGKYRQETTDVGSFPPNAFGLYDMHGNVWEWCLDDWHDNYKNAPTGDLACGSAWNSDNKHEIKVLRGGSWDYLAKHCRCGHRREMLRDSRNYHFGFRVVLCPQN